MLHQFSQFTICDLQDVANAKSEQRDGHEKLRKGHGYFMNLFLQSLWEPFAMFFDADLYSLGSTSYVHDF